MVHRLSMFFLSFSFQRGQYLSLLFFFEPIHAPSPKELRREQNETKRNETKRKETNGKKEERKHHLKKKKKRDFLVFFFWFFFCLPKQGQGFVPQTKYKLAASEPHKTIEFPNGFAVYGITDVHSSFHLNMKWVQELCSQQHFPSSILLVAGDVAETLDTVKETLLLFQKAFTHVFYCPGNHDLWITDEEKKKGGDSISKLFALLQLCEKIGVHTLPTRVTYGNQKQGKEEGGEGKQKGVQHVWIVPILSWHHASFDNERDIPQEEANIPPYYSVFQDFSRCSWRGGLDPLTPQVAEFVDKINDERDSETLFETISQSGDPIISFSHFLPHLELLPEKRFLYFPNLAKVVGSFSLQARVRKLKPRIHLFGHTHFGWDMEIEGTHFIQSPLAYPNERKQRMKSLYVGEERQDGVFSEPVSPLKIFDSEKGNFESTFWAEWSGQYKTRKRDPENTELAPWVKGRWN